MSELTLDEAIRHCLEVAEQNEAKAQKIGVQFLGTTKDLEATECRECAADHRQLAEWLIDYKEAVRLLKLAIEDIASTESCFLCKYYDGPEESCRTTDDCFVWRYADEALKFVRSVNDDNR